MPVIHRIRTDEPYRKMWDMYSLFENEESAKSILEKRYQNLGREDPVRDAYHATPKMIYNIKQARAFYRSAGQCDIFTKPLLLYYGMVSLAKALITAQDPYYPTRTSVLKHGLTTRKLKRDDYRFIWDDAKVQKDGLFQTLHNSLLGIPLKNQEKFIMRDLLAAIPDLKPMYERLYGPSCTARLRIEEPVNSPIPHTITQNPEPAPHFTRCNLWISDRTLLQGAQKTKEEAIHIWTNSVDNERFLDLDSHDPPGKLQVLRYFRKQNPNEHPCIYYDLTGDPYLFLPRLVHHQIPELGMHFIIMFVLGMLCRYETERWGELILTFSSQDLVIINEFLSVSMRKFPNLVLNSLLQEVFYFYSV
jgi:hypothetical protein